MIIPRYYEDIHTLDVGTEPLRSYYIPTSPAQDRNWTDRRETDRFTLLNGDWRFRYFESVYDCREEFFREGYNTGGFDTIPVPSNWQDHGYGLHQYTNARYPFPFDPPYVPYENPCGAYVRTFSCRKESGDFTYHLNFEGVDSCLYVWLNGEFLGYHQVSHSTAEFDITRQLRDGENTLAALVLKWCDGSYLEDQDKLRQSGIFRDVYILARPADYVRDYYLHTALKDNYTAADVTVDLSFAGEPLPVRFRLVSPEGEIEAEGVSEGERIAFSVSDISLWNAEAPCLYTLWLETADECIRERVGFREITVKDSVVRLNGQKIRFHGVNRHDSDPFVGSAVTLDHIRRDMGMMKQNNFNAIRTSHYPNAPEFYELCDRYGFYVIDEADMEAHGVEELYNLDRNWETQERPFLPAISDDPEWTESITDRVRKCVIRDKNRPSVVIWSMGNESGYGCTFEEALAWARAYDPDRLLHYESAMHYPNHPRNGRNNFDNIDLRSRMYASIPELHAYLGNHPDKPFIHCEYCHAMGNGPGDPEDYHEIEQQYDTYAGGFVWEWCDHGVYMGTTSDGRRKFYYGGDSGEFPHDGNFCMDGLVYPDRTPHTGLRELKNVHRPVRVRAEDVTAGLYTLQNNLDFTNLKDYLYLSYQVLCDGDVIEEGEIRDAGLLDVGPRSSRTVRLPITPRAPGKCSCVIRSRRLRAGDFADAGQELGFDQIALNEQDNGTVLTLLSRETSDAPAVTAAGDDRSLRISGADFVYRYNKFTGLFDCMVYRNHSFLDHPMEMNIWRAPADNDRVVKPLWYAAGYDSMQTRAYETKTETLPDGSLQIRAASSMAPVYRQRFLDIETAWTVKPDGTVLCSMEIERDAFMRGELAEYFRQPGYVDHMFWVDDAYLPRLGIRMFLPDSMNEAEYFGYGPYESYIDKHQASYIGKFRSDVSAMHEDYIRPQENGSHYCCDYVSAEDTRQKLTVYSRTPFSFNLSKYTAEELTAKKHNYELEKCGHTVLCVDYRQSGLGSGSCGPQLLNKYRLNGTHYSFSFHMKPEVKA